MQHSRPEDIKLRRRATGCPIPLTPWQRRVWSAMIKRGTRLSDWTMYHASVRVLGPLKVSLLQECIELVIQRHESLRTRIVSVDGIHRQHIDHGGKYHLQTVDLERLAQGNIQTTAQGLIQDFADTDRDLSVRPPFEVKLVRLSSNEHLLLVALEHMFSDMVSIGILSRDIWTLYNQALEGRSPSLPPLPLQFADYSVWQELTCGTWRAEHEGYWKARLSGATSIQFPVGDGVSRGEDCSIRVVEFFLGKMLSVRLRDVARQEGTLLPLVILAVYVAVISRWCSQRDIVLTFVSHGRHCHAELQDMIGLLLQRLFLRVELHEADTFRALLKKIVMECHAAHEHQDFNRLGDLISGCPTDFCFNWMSGKSVRPTADKQVSDENLLEVQPLHVERSQKKMDTLDIWHNLTLIPREAPTGLLLAVAYRSYLFTPSGINRFAGYFRLLAEEFAKNPLSSIAAIPLA